VKETRRLRYLVGIHNHDATPWKPLNAKLRDEQTSLITTFTDMVSAFFHSLASFKLRIQTPIQVINRTTANPIATLKYYLPRKGHQAAHLVKKRKDALGLPPVPSNAHFEIPDKLLSFSDAELFVLHDTGVNDPKVS